MKYISSSSYLGRGGRRRSVDDVGVVADPVEVLAEEDAVVVGVVMLELLETES